MHVTCWYFGFVGGDFDHDADVIGDKDASTGAHDPESERRRIGVEPYDSLAVLQDIAPDNRPEMVGRCRADFGTEFNEVPLATFCAGNVSSRCCTTSDGPAYRLGNALSVGGQCCLCQWREAGNRSTTGPFLGRSGCAQ